MTELTRGVYDFIRPNSIEISDGNGPLTVDGTVNIGNTVTVLNNPQANLLFATGTVSSSGNNQLIAAPGAGQIKIVTLQIQNESSIETTAILNFGATAKWRFMAKERGAGFVLQLHPSYVWLVGVGNALVLNLSGANSFGYNIVYYVE